MSNAGRRIAPPIVASFILLCVYSGCAAMAGDSLTVSGTYPNYHVTDASSTYVYALCYGNVYNWIVQSVYWEGVEGFPDEGTEYWAACRQFDESQPEHASELHVWCSSNKGVYPNNVEWQESYEGLYQDQFVWYHDNGAVITFSITQNFTGVEAEEFTVQLTAVNHSSTERTISIGASTDSGVSWWASGTAVTGGTTQISDTELIDDDEDFTVSIYVDGDLYRYSAGNTGDYPSGTVNYNISLSLWTDDEEIDEINPESPPTPDVFDEAPVTPQPGADGNDDLSPYPGPPEITGGADAGNDTGPIGSQSSEFYNDSVDALNASGKPVTVEGYSAGNDMLPIAQFEEFQDRWGDMIDAMSEFEDALVSLVGRLREVYIVTTSDRLYSITIPWDDGTRTISWEIARPLMSKMRLIFTYFLYLIFYWQVYKVGQYVVTGGRTGVG